jgi:hypothetical protein
VAPALADDISLQMQFLTLKASILKVVGNGVIWLPYLDLGGTTGD